MGRSRRERARVDDGASRVVTIVNQRGLHARAAARFVKTAEMFRAKVTVKKDGVEVSGASIMGLMMLAAGTGCEIEIRARGSDAGAAVAALSSLIADRFDED